MAGMAAWFLFTSKEQRRQQEQDYYKRMFPMGEPQRTREKELLEQCVLTEIAPNEKLYQLQIVKEALMQPDEERKLAALKKWYGARLSKKLPPRERAMVLALGELEQECRTVEDIPAAKEIRERSLILMEEWIPKLQPGRTLFERKITKLFPF